MNWKNHERNIAKTIGEMIGKQLRRNDAKHNAGDPARNSDIDVVDKTFQGPCTSGLTIECKYKKNGFASVYNWYKKMGGEKSSPKLLVINNKFLIFHIKHLLTVWKALQNPVNLSELNVEQVTTSIDFVELIGARDQAIRYAESKNLFPVVCIRKGGQQALMIVDKQDWFNHLA